MLEGLPPHRPTHVLRLLTDERSARAMTELLGEMFDPTETAVAAFEAEDGVTWRLEAYFADAPDEAMIRELIRPVVGAQADAPASRPSTSRTGCALAGRPEAGAAGRFFVHGAHDRRTCARNDLAIEIEAALAFGTGHHGTTPAASKCCDASCGASARATRSTSAPAARVLAIAVAQARAHPGAGDRHRSGRRRGRRRQCAPQRRRGALSRPSTAPGFHHADLRGARAAST